MTVQTSSEIVQLPAAPETLVVHERRLCDVTVSFNMADLEFLWGAANERGITIQELVRIAALEDAQR